MTAEYFYLDVTLELEREDFEIPPVYFQKHIIDGLNSLFGEVGASIPFDVLKYEQDTRSAIIRVPTQFSKKLYAALTLNGKFNDTVCAYRVNKTSDSLETLLA